MVVMMIKMLIIESFDDGSIVSGDSKGIMIPSILLNHSFCCKLFSV